MKAFLKFPIWELPFYVNPVDFSERFGIWSSWKKPLTTFDWTTFFIAINWPWIESDG